MVWIIALGKVHFDVAPPSITPSTRTTKQWGGIKGPWVSLLLFIIWQFIYTYFCDSFELMNHFIEVVVLCVTNPNKRKSSHERLLKNWLGSVSCMLVVQLGLQTHHNMTVSNIAVVFLNERPFGSWVGRIFVVWRNNGGLGAFTTNFSAASQREWLCRQKCFLFQILLLFFIRKSSF